MLLLPQRLLLTKSPKRWGRSGVLPRRKQVAEMRIVVAGDEVSRTIIVRHADRSSFVKFEAEMLQIRSSKCGLKKEGG